MIPVTDPRIDSYLMRMASETDPQLEDMEEKAREADFPIVGRLVGRLLYLLTRLKKPALIVELGSGFGYSAYWFARALGITGRVVLIDYAEENIAYARQVFHDAGFAGRAEFRVGDALRIGQEYENIDLLFIDIDKILYPDAIGLMLPRLAENALVVADNSLWHGKVAEEGAQDNDTGAIRKFNEFMFNNDDFLTSIVPLRDGVLLAYRIR